MTYTLSGGGVPGFAITVTTNVCAGTLYAVIPAYSVSVPSPYPEPAPVRLSCQPGTSKSAVAVLFGDVPPLTKVNATPSYVPGS